MQRSGQGTLGRVPTDLDVAHTDQNADTHAITFHITYFGTPYGTLKSD
jgi:hypothetical protein